MSQLHEMKDQKQRYKVSFEWGLSFSTNYGEDEYEVEASNEQEAIRIAEKKLAKAGHVGTSWQSAMVKVERIGQSMKPGVFSRPNKPATWMGNRKMNEEKSAGTWKTTWNVQVGDETYPIEAETRDEAEKKIRAQMDIPPGRLMIYKQASPAQRMATGWGWPKKTNIKEDTTIVKSMVEHASKNNPADFEQSFRSMISAKVYDAIQERRKELAATMFIEKLHESIKENLPQTTGEWVYKPGKDVWVEVFKSQMLDGYVTVPGKSRVVTLKVSVLDRKEQNEFIANSIVGKRNAEMGKISSTTVLGDKASRRS